MPILAIIMLTKGQIMVVCHVTKKKKNLSHTIFSGGQLSFNIHHTYVQKRIVFRSSEVNDCQPEASHLTSNLLETILFLNADVLAFI